MPKRKRTRFPLGEDGCSATPTSISVADGIGGTAFTSHYLSKLLSIASSLHFLNTNLLSQSASDLNAAMNDYKASLLQTIGQHSGFMLNCFNGYQTESDCLLRQLSSCEHSSSIIESASTLTTAYITPPHNNEQRLRIFQKGDSQILLLRKLEAEKPEALFYEPVLATLSQQKAFNQPFSFQVNPQCQSKIDNDVAGESFAFEAELQPEDVVIAATDGFFDNVSLNFLAFLFNFIIAQMTKPAFEQDRLNVIVDEVL